MSRAGEQPGWDKPKAARGCAALVATIPIAETHGPKAFFAPFSQQKFLLLLLEIFAQVTFLQGFLEKQLVFIYY